MLLLGPIGCGKTTVLRMLESTIDPARCATSYVACTQFSTLSKLQGCVVASLETQKQQNCNRVVIEIDDLHCVTAATQQQTSAVCEMLRQILDGRCLYTPSQTPLAIDEFSLVCTQLSPSTDVRKLPPRLERLFLPMLLAEPTIQTIRTIFSGIMSSQSRYTDIVDRWAEDTASLFVAIRKQLLPSMDTPHYLFNYHDVVRCCSGLALIDLTVTAADDVVQAWNFEMVGCMSIHMFARKSIHMSVHMSIHIFVHMSMHMSMHMSHYTGVLVA